MVISLPEDRRPRPARRTPRDHRGIVGHDGFRCSVLFYGRFIQRNVSARSHTPEDGGKTGEAYGHGEDRKGKDRHSGRGTGTPEGVRDHPGQPGNIRGAWTSSSISARATAWRRPRAGPAWRGTASRAERTAFPWRASPGSFTTRPARRAGRRLPGKDGGSRVISRYSRRCGVPDPRIPSRWAKRAKIPGFENARFRAYVRFPSCGMVNAKRSINQALPIRYTWERVHERFGAGSFPEGEGFPLCHGNAFMRRSGLPDADRDLPQA